MKNFGIALAVIAALTMGAVSTADAQGKSRRDGAHKQRNTSVQHRASPRKFQHGINHRQARQHSRIRQGWQRGNLNRRELSRLGRDQRRVGKLERRFGADGHYSRHERRVMKGALDHSSNRIWRMKHNYRGWKRGWKRGYRKNRRYHHGFRRPYRHHPHAYPVYPVYDSSPGYSHGLEIETEEFRFKVYGSS